MIFFFKQKTAYEMRISDGSSDVCSSDLPHPCPGLRPDAKAGKPAPSRAMRRWCRRSAGAIANMLSPQATIEPAELETGLKRLVIEALFSNTTAALTTGVVLTAFALHLGANNATIGLLAAIPFPTQLAQIPAIALVERLPSEERGLGKECARTCSSRWARCH